MGLWIALQFLTIIPVPKRFEAKLSYIGDSLVYFPLGGLFLGLILALISWALSYILPLQIISALVVISLVVLTGAHHLDGLADTFDGVIAGRTVSERIAIMSDTRIGTFGTVAIAGLLLLKYAGFSSGIEPGILILQPVLSRWSMVSLLFMYPTAKKAGMCFSYKKGATIRKFLIATLITLVITVILAGWHGLILLACVFLISFCIGLWTKSRIGGITGDTCGALNEINEAAVPLLSVIIITIERIYCG